MKIRFLSVSLTLVTITILTLSVSISAETTKSEKVCDKLKKCAVKSFEVHNLSDEMKQIVSSQLDLCAVTFAEKEQVLIDAGLGDESNAYRDEMIEMSCEQLMMLSTAKKSAACQELEKVAKQAGMEEY